MQADLEGAQALLKDSDPELRDLAEEVAEARGRLALGDSLQRMLLPKDPNDSRNVFLKSVPAPVATRRRSSPATCSACIRATPSARAGGSRRCRRTRASTVAGEVIARVEGDNVYAKLFESGAHRVQRVPETESQGRIHTSACTVAVLPEPDEQAAIEINPADLRVDTYRSSGAGGQHVNKTDSAVRITHIPSGIVVECQEERSQHKNRAAMARLAAKLNDQQQAAAQQAIASTRKLLVGSGDRSERIRTTTSRRAGHRPSHQPHPVLPGRGDGGRGGTGDRAAAAGIPGRSTGGPGRLT